MIDPVVSNMGAVVLAAGASRRMGSPKQLLPYQGESLIRRSARLALETSCRPVVVVLGAQSDRIAAELDGLDLSLVFNPHWEEGMSSSVKAGLQRALQEYPNDLQALLFLVVDQPLLEIALLQDLIALFYQTNSPLVAASYAGRPGVPAIFSRALFPDFDLLQGDQGARLLFERYHDVLSLLPFPGGEFDLDTPEDYRRLNP